MTIALIVYSLFALLFYIPIARRLAWADARRYGQSKPDRNDKGWALWVGLWVAVAWLPALAFLGLKKVYDKIDGSSLLWSEPKPLQSPVARYKENQIIKRQEAIHRQRLHINDRERELDLPLTKWSD